MRLGRAVQLSLCLLSLYCTTTPVCSNSQRRLDPVEFLYNLRSSADFQKNPGPNSPSGRLWPQPQRLVYGKETLPITKATFAFDTSCKCEILQKALLRYPDLIFPRRAGAAEAEREGGGASEWGEELGEERVRRSLGGGVVARDAEGRLTERETIPDTDGSNRKGTNRAESFTALHILVKEDYGLWTWGNGTGWLVAQSVWGALHGLETFSQLVFSPSPGKFFIRTASVSDFPRFPWRGVLLDTSRHFVGVPVLEETIDLMSQNKFNVFHWHVVDDPSFPFQSLTFPELSAKGAYSAKHVYSQDDIGRVVEYARLRGVRVLPEFDTPGHTQSWGEGNPDFLTQCYADGTPTNTRHLPDVSNTKTWDFLYALFTEVRKVFPDQFLHLGGDEVSYYYKCWQTNPKIKRVMELWNITDMRGIENYYFSTLVPLLERMDSKAQFVFWDDVFPQIKLPKDKVILQEWRRQSDLGPITAAGYKALLSSCWYLDHITLSSASHPEWYGFYQCDPQDFRGSEEQKNLVLGGEACLWGEFVDSTNLTPRLWPRASAIAERLWSSKDLQKPLDARDRMHEHRCRMILRGHAAEPPSGPSFCPVEYV